jgi:hypothetical protein
MQDKTLDKNIDTIIGEFGLDVTETTRKALVEMFWTGALQAAMAPIVEEQAFDYFREKS